MDGMMTCYGKCSIDLLSGFSMCTVPTVWESKKRGEKDIYIGVGAR